MASPVTFCAVHRPLIRPSIFSGVWVWIRVYCSSELIALSQPNSARHSAPNAQCGIRLNSAMATNDPTVVASISAPGRTVWASWPLVNAPSAAPSGIAAYSRPICPADICQLPASAG